MSIYIDGLGTAHYQISEYVSGAVSKSYLSVIASLQTILNKPAANITVTDFDGSGSTPGILPSLQQLANLAKNGAKDGDPPVTYYMSYDMAQYANLIVRSLQAAGITIDSAGSLTDSQKISAVLQWQGLAGFGIGQILTSASSVNVDVHSLQSLVELEYVKAGNDYIAKHLGQLQQALSTSQLILNTLNIVQGIANQISVAPVGSFAFPPVKLGDIPLSVRQSISSMSAFGDKVDTDPQNKQGAIFANALKDDFKLAKGVYPDLDPKISLLSQLTPDQQVTFLTGPNLPKAMTTYLGGGGSPDNNTIRFEKLYQPLASAQFTQLFPVATPSDPIGSYNGLLAAKTKFFAEIAQLQTQSGMLPTSTNSLAYFLYKVASSISAYLVTKIGGSKTNTSALALWILDNQNTRLSDANSLNAGSIQTNITQSITSAQSLNDTQKESVRQYSLFFNQFYQSASDVLQKVSQMTERMAQQISR